MRNTSINRDSTSGTHRPIRALSLIVHPAALLFLLASSCSCEGNEQGHRVAPLGGDLQYAPAPRSAYDEAIRQACGAPGPSPAGVRELLRFPYLQSVHATGAEIVWVSENESISVHLRRASEQSAIALETLTDASAKPTLGNQYVASTNDLESGTLYCYEVRSDADLLYSAGLRSAPAQDATVRFSALGDLGKDTGDQRAVLAQLKTVDSEFILITGDVAYDTGTLAQFEAYFFGVYRDLLALAPVFPATGNHDYGDGDANAFRQVFRLFQNGGQDGIERWYSLNWGPVHVVVLDTQAALAEQAAWMRADLAAQATGWTVVVLHKPPFSSGMHGPDADVEKYFVPVFVELGVDLVLAGHEHDYERTTSLDGVVYVITGGGGRGTRPVGSSAFTAYAARAAHFVFIEASPSALTLHAIDASGSEFDSMRLTK